MAIGKTYKSDDHDVWGRHYREVYELTGDASYPAGGYPITAKELGFADIRGARVIGGNAVANALLGCWDHVNKKFMVFYPTGGAAAGAALADPSVAVPAGGVTVTSDAAQPNLVETAGRGKEVTAATDLTTAKWLVEFILI